MKKPFPVTPVLLAVVAVLLALNLIMALRPKPTLESSATVASGVDTRPRNQGGSANMALRPGEIPTPVPAAAPVQNPPAVDTISVTPKVEPSPAPPTPTSNETHSVKVTGKITIKDDHDFGGESSRRIPAMQTDADLLATLLITANLEDEDFFVGPKGDFEFTAVARGAKPARLDLEFNSMFLLMPGTEDDDSLATLPVSLGPTLQGTANPVMYPVISMEPRHNGRVITPDDLKDPEIMKIFLEQMDEFARLTISEIPRTPMAGSDLITPEVDDTAPETDDTTHDDVAPTPTPISQ